MKNLRTSLLLSLTVIFGSCQEDAVSPEADNTTLEPSEGLVLDIHSKDDPTGRLGVNDLFNINTPRTDQKWSMSGDFDGNGHEDIVTLIGSRAHMLLVQNMNSPVAHTTWYTNGQYGDGSYTFSGDFNGDGKSDIASCSGSNVTMKISTGSSFNSSTWYAQSGWGAAGYTFAGDFNGDGKDDIASIVSSTGVYVRLSTGSSFNRSGGTRKTWSIPSTSFGGQAYTFAGDFDNDGDDDIMSASGDNIIVLRSTRTGFVKEVYGVDVNGDGKGDDVSWGGENHTFCADTDGDGFYELVTAMGSRMHVREFQGSGKVFRNFNSSYSHTSRWGWSYAMDITGDNTDEIVSFIGNKLYVH